MAMIRKQIYLTKDIERDVKAEAKRRGMSEASVIRERLATRSDRPGIRPPVDDEAVERLLRRIAAVTRQAKGRPGRRHGIKREELYAERTRIRHPR